MTTENHTNQPSQPEDAGNGDAHPPEPQHPGSQFAESQHAEPQYPEPQPPEPPYVSNPFRKTRPGHFASDGRSPRRGVPVQRQSYPEVPVGNAPEPPVVPAATPKRFGENFEAVSRRVVPPKKPKQPAQPPAPVLSPVRPVEPAKLVIDGSFERTRLLVLAFVMVPLCIWGSLPSWNEIVYAWYASDDYSHGFIVIPATLLFLYLRLETYPGTRYKLDWLGLLPILIYGILRHFAAQQFITPLDHIAIWFWILSIVWFFYGLRVFLWALPSLLFLVFIFQLPYTIDVMMRNELQLFAAQFAAALMQMIGMTAIPITNTIRLATMELGVEAACSGLRFLMSVFAVAFATVLLMRRPWWQNILILAIAAPLSLFVNAVRIAITGVLLEFHYDSVSGFYDTLVAWNVVSEGQTVGAFADSCAGKIGIFLALGLFALFVWYLGKVFRRVEI